MKKFDDICIHCKGIFKKGNWSFTFMNDEHISEAIHKYCIADYIKSLKAVDRLKYDSEIKYLKDEYEKYISGIKYNNDWKYNNYEYSDTKLINEGEIE